MSILYKITERVDEFVHEPLKVNIYYPHDAYPTGQANLLKPLNPVIGR
jgi:hypothetical protein